MTTESDYSHTIQYLTNKIRWLDDRIEELTKQDRRRWQEIHALADYLNLKIEELPARIGVSKKRRYFK